MNKTVIIILSFFLFLVPSIANSGESFIVASVSLAKVFNESNIGKNASTYLRELPADQRKAKAREVTKDILEKVYLVIKKIGIEEKYDLILEDKNYIFAGNKVIDITDKVIEKCNTSLK